MGVYEWHEWTNIPEKIAVWMGIKRSRVPISKRWTGIHSCIFMASCPQNVHVYLECCVISTFLTIFLNEAPYRVPYFPVIPTFLVCFSILAYLLCGLCEKKCERYHIVNCENRTKIITEYSKEWPSKDKQFKCTFVRTYTFIIIHAFWKHLTSLCNVKNRTLSILQLVL